MFERKQADPGGEDLVRPWVDEVWDQTFAATTQAILKTKPYEFSPAGLADLDLDALRAEAVGVVRDAVESEGLDLTSEAGLHRALVVPQGYLNQTQQMAMGIKF